jgi:polysaccharide biosynthesis transport protein
MAIESQSCLADVDLLAGSAGGGDRQEWRLIDCLHAVYRRKATVMYVLAACVLAAALCSLIQPRMYQSSAALEIQGVNENFLNMGDVFPATALSNGDWTSYVQTQAEMLQQESLLDQVVRALHLDSRPEFQRGPLPAARKAVLALKANLKIVPSHGSRIIRIVFDSRDPQLAADVSNTLAQVFIDSNIESRQHAAQQTYEALSTQLGILSRRLQGSEARLAEANAFDAASRRPLVSALKRDVEVDSKSYEDISRRTNDARVASAVRQSNLRLLGPAQPPTHPYKPNLPLNFAIAVVSGLILSVGVIMFREQSNPTVCLPGEAAISLALPELGVIPHAAEPIFRGRGFNYGGRKKSQPEPLVFDRLSAVSESFRATLASILSPARCGNQPQIVVVTSSVAMEGKTTVASNLGVSLTEIGRRVLLIDGDMRRPRLHKIFGEANSWGLSDILREKNAIEDLPLDVLVRKTIVPQLFLLPSGACVDNTFGLLWSGRLARLLPRFREQFDCVLVDAPPCLEFADARIMGRYADQLLLVLRANYTDRRTAQDAVRRLALDGIPMLGVILNCYDPSRRGPYSGGYRFSQ